MSSSERQVAFLLGLPFHMITMDETIEDAVAAIAARNPSYYITANVDFIAQAHESEPLKDILFHADRVVCDGMPLVWLSRYFHPVLPERVAGSDMVFRLFSEANERAWKVFFLGSDATTLSQTKSILAQQYPKMEVVGTFSPPFGPVDSWPNEAILADIKGSQPDLLLVAVGCPKQEYWISKYYKEAAVPLSIGIGASLDFICGTQVRAPVWIQKIGMEWCWRMLSDPKRLVKRYAKDLYYLVVLANLQRRITSQATSEKDQSAAADRESAQDAGTATVDIRNQDVQWISWSGEAERSVLETLERPADTTKPVFINLSAVSFMDSSAIGLLAKFARDARKAKVAFGIVQPADRVVQIIEAMHLSSQFPVYADRNAALEVLHAPDVSMTNNQTEGTA
ncbi:WecB/TagA/CpsF family glycosyltransferase [Coraliomargarita sp. SDUM461004]|uniref:WecB/TagA/CpsF family glycosyltransferase n=1 Tax=Thalassobacterium sedimentorum TaxID=3041258 RepID=A0ABU1AJK6_9BACT|nr:WecB/TagA/CpsF family glycosyltransferase [Coraliomargarita sp. SDUM461004]MDQ8193793.1 WecB/TagA/CpsF family glycosyltransferase [Coraliomargarita sp. SDUM461004]